MIKNILLLPFRTLWNLIVTVFIVLAFILWFGFIFGSVIAVILILIFMPELFLLPIAIAAFYVPMWDDI